MSEIPSPAPPWWLRSASVAWAGTLLLLIVVGLTAGFLLREQRALERGELQSAELYARVLQDHGDRTFNTLDIAMTALADSVDLPPRRVELRHLDLVLAQAAGGLPFVRSFSVVAAGGRVLASSSAANVGVEVEMALLARPGGGAPDALGAAVPGRDLADARRGRPAAAEAGRRFLPLVRPAGEGRYLVAALNPDFFGNEYERLLADATRSAGLFSIDAVMLAGTGNLQQAPGQRAAGHRFFTRFLPGRESGSDIGPGIDGGTAASAFRLLRKRPLVVIVERGERHLLTGLRSTLLEAAAICAGAVLVIAAAMVFGRRRLKSHETVRSALEATRNEIAASERELRVLVESVHELIFRVDREGRIDFVNGRWQQLTRRPAADVLGKRLSELCREDDRPACAALFARREIQSEALLVNVADAGGAWLTLDLSASRVLDACGRTTGFAGFALDVSAREAARRALQAQLTFNAQLLELSPTPIFVKNEHGKFVSVNRAWLELMGLALPDVLGRDSTDLYGDAAAKHRAQDERLLQAEERISYENRLVVRGRAPRDTVVTKVRFVRGDGAPAGIVGSIIDVTEFREAERDIRRARDAAEQANGAKSEFIANISHELRTPLQGILGFSDLGRDLAAERPEFRELFTDIHAGGRRMLTLVNGLLDVSQMDSAVGSLPLQRVDLGALVREAVAQLQAQAAARGLVVTLQMPAAPVECDADSARLQQAVRHVLANAVRYSPPGGAIAVTLADGAAAGLELTVRDHGPGIPEDELERIFEAFVQSTRTRDGAGGTGLGLTIARKIVAAHGGSLVAGNAEGGGALVRLRLPAAGVVSAAPVASAVAEVGLMPSNGRPLSAEARELVALLERRLNAERAERRRLQQQLDALGRQLPAAGEEPAALAERLERLIEQRTRALSLARDEAVSASRSKSSFLANMSHEIRTPLTSIIGFAELLQNPHVPGAEKVDAAKTIVRNGRHLLEVVNDILDMSKIESNQLTLERIEVGLPKLLGDIEALVSGRAQEKGLVFTIGHHLPLPPVLLTDPVRLKQILLNFCSNAVKFSREGEVRLDVRFDAAAATLCFEVTDAGIGMGEQELARLFKPFVQADVSITRRFGGTGLGLYISRQLADLLGGSIGVASEAGRGSRFSVTVPLGVALRPLELLDRETDFDDFQRPGFQITAIEVPQLGGRVLVAEDGADNQRLLASLLRQTGVAFDIVGNGSLAVERALARDYALVFMDIQMPVMDGVSATRMLRSAGYRGPIVALTANVMQEDVALYRSCGCTDVLGKPIDRALFYDALRRHVGELPLPAGDGYAAELAALTAEFAAGLPAIAAAIAEARGADDRSLLRTLLHKLKGTAGSYGFGELTALAATAETALAEGEPGALRAACGRLVQACAAATSA